jgi:hypothetical protein
MNAQKMGGCTVAAKKAAEQVPVGGLRYIQQLYKFIYLLLLAGCDLLRLVPLRTHVHFFR